MLEERIQFYKKGNQNRMEKNGINGNGINGVK